MGANQQNWATQVEGCSPYAPVIMGKLVIPIQACKDNTISNRTLK